jgi:1,4-alpha-glucan branching enzyme
MSNNKQHLTDWIFEQLEEMGDLRETLSIRNVQLNIDTSDYMELKQQARKMYRDEIEAAAIISSAEQSTKAASQKTEAFAIGYDQGYKRAVDYMKETLKNKIEIKEDANNEFRKGTANTTGTTFLCTEFVSDQLFYKGTLPHCMRCGKAQYQHPIISNT